LATLIGCAEFDRPTFPGQSTSTDTTPPQIQFVAPLPGDTIIASGSSVTISVAVRDASGVTSLTCGVSGAVSFGFPSMFPDDTATYVLFPVPTTGKKGRVVVSVDAADAAGNVGSKTFAFEIR
jgi:hypothetical protein